MIPIGPEFLIASQAWNDPHAAAIAARGRLGHAFHDAAVLGTRLNLIITAEHSRDAMAAARSVRAEIDRLNTVFNWRTAGSELARLNRSERHVASAELLSVVAAAERWRAATGGAFSGRLGRVLAPWIAPRPSPPDRAQVADLAQAADAARVEIDLETRTIVRPDAVRFDLDGLAKGHIVDRALAAAIASPGVRGALVDIGGDIRCAGQAPLGAWRIGLPDPLLPFDNAPLLGSLRLREGAVATSGCGPRDRTIGHEVFSATLDPRTGWPAPRGRSATAVAGSAMEADALATSLLNMPSAAGAELIRAMPGTSARIEGAGGVEWLTGGAGPSGAPAAQWTPVRAGPARSPKAARWHDRWVAMVTFTAPPRQLERDRAFRSPYVAIWISDETNRPVRTLVLIGTIKEWQQDNYIWWGHHRSIAQNLLDTRSMSTRGTGTYRLLWDGHDERGVAVPPGKYRVHVETSRERGRHTHRALDVDFSQPRQFTAELPRSEESGGLVVSFERF